MDKFKEIRPIVVGLVKKDNKVLGMLGTNSDGKKYIRLIGGGVEFLEKLEYALRREFKEELNMEIKINKYLEFEDNIFVYHGKNAHEHVFIYDVDLLGEVEDNYTFAEVTEDKKMYHVVNWIDIDDIKSGKIIIYPEIAKNYI